MVRTFADWFVGLAQTNNIAVVGTLLVIAITLVSCASFLKDRLVDVVARVVGAIAMTFAAWAAWTSRWALLDTLVYWLSWAAVVAVVGTAALAAVRFARNREAMRARAKYEASADTDDEFARMAADYKRTHPEEWASIEAQVRKAA